MDLSPEGAKGVGVLWNQIRADRMLIKPLLVLLLVKEVSRKKVPFGTAPSGWIDGGQYNRRPAIHTILKGSE